MPKPSLLIPTIPTQSRRAWPKYPDAKPVSYLPVRAALTRAFSTDVHLAAYAMPSHPYRLSSGAVGHPQLPDGVCMVLALFDIDGHQHTDVEGWWSAERPKVMALRSQHPDLFAYRTRSGFRIVGGLAEPIMLCTSGDVEAWRQRYLTWIAYLVRCFDIRADPSCKDWTRLFRLPHGTRGLDHQPEAHEVIGNAQHLGPWAPEITSADVEWAVSLGKHRPKRQTARVREAGSVNTGERLLYHAFVGHGWIGYGIEADKWAVACPWEKSHTMGERFDTSTILWAPGPGDEVGWWHCSHGHCEHRDLRDVLRLFTLSELDQARQAAGIVSRDHWAKCGLRTVDAKAVILRRGIRTIDAKEVSAWRR